MRILWVIHLYPPIHNCGAEYVVHNVNKYLQSKGHEVRVLNMQSDDCYIFEGVEVLGGKHCEGIDPYFWGDVICTHLEYSQHAINMGHFTKRPVLNFVHNSCPYESIINALDKQYIVYNSNWIADELHYETASITLYPPCPFEKYKIPGFTPSNEGAITLINFNENKGGYLLYRLAKELPHKKFIGVIGSYDHGGLMDDIENLLRSCFNVTVVDHTPNVNEIYRQTGILLMLSREESWGRTATEAMINGIPVIACPTPGLKENLAYAGLFVPERGKKEYDTNGNIKSHDGFTYNLQPVIDIINDLDDPKKYAIRSHISIRRAEVLNDAMITQFNELENFINYAATDFKAYGRNGNGINRARVIAGS